MGIAGQTALSKATVAVIGIGGLGCPAALYLANSGVGRLVLNDFDRVDESNLPRQILFQDSDVGSAKVVTAAQRLSQSAPTTQIETVDLRLDAVGLLQLARRADVMLDCTDNFQTRIAINQACVEANCPLVVGAAIRLEGQLAVFPTPAAGPCYHCVYRQEDELLGDCQGNGVLAPVPGVIGSLMATEALKLLVLESEPTSRLLLWDAAAGDWQSLTINQDAQCPACGRQSKP
jgi:adenylyltransferase/sulfurtransferase